MTWTPEEKTAWDDLIKRLSSNYPIARVNVASKRRQAAILKADQIIKSDTRFIVSIPDNDWRDDDNRGVNYERWFAVYLYIEGLRCSLEAQGFIVK